jgi:sugar phosphate isomerase/epimerase
VADEPKEKTLERVSSGLRTLGEHVRGSNLKVIIESHGDFVDSPTLLKILEGANHPNVALLWDAHHTCVAGKEAPEFTYSKLSKYICHTHLKDSVPDKKDVRYVATGEGNVPVRETVLVLKKNGYKGYYCFEWEKMWHPEIAEPEQMFPHYAKVMREYLA